MPVLNQSRQIIGIITAQDVVEAVDDEMGEDYAKLAGLTAEEDLNETTGQSIKKRLPWLMILLVLGMLVSSVVGAFEGVVAILPIVICFQSMVLDMAGNVGTQSLAVTIRVLMDEELGAKEKRKLVAKESKAGMFNGLLLGALAVAFLGVYVRLFKGYAPAQAFLISFCVGVALLLSMIVSSLVGTLVPMFFKKIKVDPGRGLRSANHNDQRFGGSSDLLRLGVGAAYPSCAYCRVNGVAILQPICLPCSSLAQRYYKQKKHKAKSLAFFIGADYETRPVRFCAHRHARGHRNSPPDCCYPGGLPCSSLAQRYYEQKSTRRNALCFLLERLRDSPGALLRAPARTRAPQQSPGLLLP